MKRLLLALILLLLLIQSFMFSTAEGQTEDNDDADEQKEFADAVSQIRIVSDLSNIRKGPQNDISVTDRYGSGFVKVNGKYNIVTLWHNYGNRSLVDVKINIYENGVLIGHTLLNCDSDGYNDYAVTYRDWSPKKAGPYFIKVELDLYPAVNYTFEITALNEDDYNERFNVDSGFESAINRLKDDTYIIPVYILIIIGLIIIVGLILLLTTLIKRRKKSRQSKMHFDKETPVYKDERISDPFRPHQDPDLYPPSDKKKHIERRRRNS